MNIDFIALPVAGAFIGYLTNYIAIKMLFYPKRPYYLFGLRIPFTPGLIPKKRRQIIDKISESIASNIVKKDDIIRYLYKKENRETLYRIARTYIEEIGNKKLWDLVGSKHLRRVVKDLVDRYFDAFLRDQLDDFMSRIDGVVEGIVDSEVNLDVTLRDILKEEGVGKVRKLVYEYVRKILISISDSMDSDEMRSLIRSKIVAAMDRYADDSNIVVASLVSMVAPLVEDNDKLVEVVVSQLQSALLDFKTYDMVKIAVFNVFEREAIDRSLGDVLQRSGFGSRDDIKLALSKKIESLLKKQSFRRVVADRISAVVDKEKLAIRVLAFIRVVCTKYSVRDSVEFVNPGLFDELHVKLVNTLLYLISKNREAVFNFDIGNLAKKRLDSLDISRVEDIVLNISKDQFKYIDLFGGLLGFLIGVLEIFLRFKL